MEKPSKPKEDIRITITNEAITRLKKRLATLDATIEDKPLEEVLKIDEQISNLLQEFSKCKTGKQFNEIQMQVETLQFQRANCWKRHKKQANYSKLWDEKFNLEREIEAYQEAAFYFSLNPIRKRNYEVF